MAPFRAHLSIAVTFFMVLWTSVNMFFLALSPGMVVGTALLELHETWKGGLTISLSLATARIKL